MFIKNIKKSGKVVLAVIFLLATWYVNITHYHKTKFVSDDGQTKLLQKSLQQANLDVLMDRHKLLVLYSHFKKHQPIGVYQLSWLRHQIYKKMLYFNPYSEQDWQQLMNKVDVVPINLVLQSAAQQSHFATTPLAKQGDNYFNILIAKAEYGMPKFQTTLQQRNTNWLEADDIQYASYFSPQTSISDYMWILNTASQYQAFRHARALLRHQHKNIATITSTNLQTLVSTAPLASASLYGNASLPAL